jgi:hypothetical protein
MSRKIIYRIEDHPGNTIADDRWDEVMRLQHWYNSEFAWTAGKLSFRRYVIFPNTEEFKDLSTSIRELIAQRHQRLLAEGLTEYQIVSQMEKDRLLVVKWGGYYDGCLASGFTRVADNEWNAFLVCDFLLKASTLCPRLSIRATDEGKFIKTGSIWFRNGGVLISGDDNANGSSAQQLCDARRVFSVVDPAKYDEHPAFKNLIPEFNKLKAKEKMEVVRNWNWLGYDDGYDADGDDVKGFNLNVKVRQFRLTES